MSDFSDEEYLDRLRRSMDMAGWNEPAAPDPAPESAPEEGAAEGTAGDPEVQRLQAMVDIKTGRTVIGEEPGQAPAAAGQAPDLAALAAYGDKTAQDLYQPLYTGAPPGVYKPEAYADLFRAEIAASDDPVETERRLNSAYYMAQLEGLPFSEAYNNLDALTMTYYGKAQSPKNWHQAIETTWRAATIGVEISKVAYALGQSGGTDQALLDRIAQLESYIPAQDQLKRSLPTEALKAAAQFLPSQIESLKGALPVGVSGAAGGAAAIMAGAALGLPLVGIGAIAIPTILMMGFRAGNAVGAFKVTKEIEAGSLYYDLLKTGETRIVDGKEVVERVNPQIAWIAAQVHGAIAGATEMLPADQYIVGVAKAAGLEKALGKAVNKVSGTVSDAAARAGVFQRFFKKFVSEQAKKAVEGAVDVASETLQEVVQEGSAILAGEYAKQLTNELEGTDLTPIERREVRQRITDTLVQSAMGMTAMKAIPGGLKLLAGTGATAHAAGKATKVYKAEETGYGDIKLTDADLEVYERRAKEEKAPQLRMVRSTVVEGEEYSLSAVDGATGKPLATARYEFEPGTGSKPGTMRVLGLKGGASPAVNLELMKSLALNFAGWDIEFAPKTANQAALKALMTKLNPRGPSAGLSWFTVDAEIPAGVTREYMDARLQQVAPGWNDADRSAAINTLGLWGRRFGMTGEEMADAIFAPGIFVPQLVRGKDNRLESGRVLTPDMIAQGAAGATTWRYSGESIKALVDMAPTANPSTFLHEVTHAVTSFMLSVRDGQAKVKNAAAVIGELDAIERAIGVKNGDWNAEFTGWTSEAVQGNRSYWEAFTYAMEDYLVNGNAPTEELKGIFERFKQWILDIYKGLRGARVEMSPELESYFDGLFGDSAAIWNQAPVTSDGLQEAAAPAGEAAEKAAGSEGDEEMPLFQGETNGATAKGFRDLYQGEVYKTDEIIRTKPWGKMPGRQILATLKAAGVKSEELEWTGLEEFLATDEKLTPAQVKEHLDGNRLKIEEVVKGGEGAASGAWDNITENDIYTAPTGDGRFKAYAGEEFIGEYESEEEAREEAIAALEDARNQNPPRYEKYVLPGGENYREVLFTLPVNQDKEVKPMVRARFYRRNGWTMWKIYSPEEMPQLIATLAEGDLDKVEQEPASMTLLRGPAPYHSSHWNEPNVLAHTRLNDRTDDQGRSLLFVEEIQSDWHQDGRKLGYKSEAKTIPGPFGGEVPATMEDAKRVPDAPFKKNWHEFVFRKILREAADNRYDAVAWTTGAQQAERYGISHVVDELAWVPAGDDVPGYGRLVGSKSDDVVLDEYMHETRIPEFIGEELTEKLLSTQRVEGEAQLKGLELEVGGSGMKGFYDKILVDYANKLGKKWGARVEDAHLPGNTTHEVIARPMGENQRSLGTFANYDAAKIARDDYNASGAGLAEIETRGDIVHALPITDEMRERILRTGVALFQGEKTRAPGTAERKNLDGAIEVRPAERGERRGAFQKATKDMGVEELREAIRANPVSAIPGKVAYREDTAERRAPVQVSMDLDSLKWINDNLGHEAGDEMLRITARVLDDVAESYGLKAYHLSGDEYALTGDSIDDVLLALAEVDERLKDVILKSDITPDVEAVLRGPRITYGVDGEGDLRAADERLGEAKREKERRGERAARGEIPGQVDFIRKSDGQALDRDRAREILDAAQRDAEEARGSVERGPGGLYSPAAVAARMRALIEERRQQATRETLYSITAHHGAKAGFDKFDLGYIGTGEGQQVYGWGIYLTENEGVARTQYAGRLGKSPSLRFYKKDGNRHSINFDSTDTAWKRVMYALKQELSMLEPGTPVRGPAFAATVKQAALEAGRMELRRAQYEDAVSGQRLAAQVQQVIDYIEQNFDETKPAEIEGGHWLYNVTVNPQGKREYVPAGEKWGAPVDQADVQKLLAATKEWEEWTRDDFEREYGLGDAWDNWVDEDVDTPGIYMRGFIENLTMSDFDEEFEELNLPWTGEGLAKYLSHHMLWSNRDLDPALVKLFNKAGIKGMTPAEGTRPGKPREYGAVMLQTLRGLNRWRGWTPKEFIDAYGVAPNSSVTRESKSMGMSEGDYLGGTIEGLATLWEAREIIKGDSVADLYTHLVKVGFGYRLTDKLFKLAGIDKDAWTGEGAMMSVEMLTSGEADLGTYVGDYSAEDIADLGSDMLGIEEKDLPAEAVEKVLDSMYDFLAEMGDEIPPVDPASVEAWLEEDGIWDPETMPPDVAEHSKKITEIVTAYLELYRTPDYVKDAAISPQEVNAAAAIDAYFEGPEGEPVMFLRPNEKTPRVIPGTDGRWLQWEKEIPSSDAEQILGFIGQLEEALQKDDQDGLIARTFTDGSDEEFREALPEILDEVSLLLGDIPPDTTGSVVYQAIAEAFGVGAEESASRLLLAAGFDGVRYPVAFLTGGRGDKGSNYVVFNDDAIVINRRTLWQGEGIGAPLAVPPGSVTTALLALTTEKRGVVEAATSRESIGPIAIPWGVEGREGFTDGFGLAKILRKHGRDNVLAHLKDVLEKGAIYTDPTAPERKRLILYKEYRAVIKLYRDDEQEGPGRAWLMTCYIPEISRSTGNPVIPTGADLVEAGEPQNTEGRRVVVRRIRKPLAQGDAYHGSHAAIDRFSTDYMGSGEGAQAYGWGLYFTESESVARDYAHKGARRKLIEEGGMETIAGKPYTEYDYKVYSAMRKYLWAKREKGEKPTAADALKYMKAATKGEPLEHHEAYYVGETSSGNKVDVVVAEADSNEELDAEIERGGWNRTGKEFLKRSKKTDVAIVLEALARGDADFNIVEGKRHLYEVTLWPGREAVLLHWETPLKDQPAETIAALAKLGIKVASDDDWKMASEEAEDELIGDWEENLPGVELTVEWNEADETWDYSLGGEYVDSADSEEAAWEAGEAVQAEAETRQAMAAETDARNNVDERERDERATEILKEQGFADSFKTWGDYWQEWVEEEDSKDISAQLMSAGIDGVRMPVNWNSGGRGENGYNYVVFDDAEIRINRQTLYMAQQTREGQAAGEPDNGQSQLYGVVRDMEAEGKGWESFMAYVEGTKSWMPGAVSAPEDLDAAEKEAWYRTVWDEALKDVRRGTDLDDWLIRLAENGHAQLKAFLSALWDKVLMREREAEQAGFTTEDAAIYEQERTRAYEIRGQLAEPIIAGAINAGAKSGRMAPAFLGSLMGIIRANPEEYAAIYGEVMGDDQVGKLGAAAAAAKYEGIETDARMKERMGISARAAIAAKIRDEQLERRVVAGLVTGTEIAEYVGRLQKASEKDKKKLQELQADLKESDAIADARTREVVAARKQLQEGKAEAARINRRIRSYLDRSQEVPEALASQKAAIDKRRAALEKKLASANDYQQLTENLEKAKAKLERAELAVAQARARGEDASRSVLRSRSEANAAIRDIEPRLKVAKEYKNSAQLQSYLAKMEAELKLKDKIALRDAERREVKKLRAHREALVKAIMRPTGNIAVAYAKDIHAIQDAIDPTNPTKASQEKIDLLRSELEKNPALAAEIPRRWMKRALGKNLNEMTLEELEATERRVRELREAGRAEQKRRERERQEDYEAYRARIADIVMSLPGYKEPTGYEPEKDMKAKLLEKFREFNYGWMNAQRFAERLDNGKHGQNYELLVLERDRHYREEMANAARRKEAILAGMKERGIDPAAWYRDTVTIVGAGPERVDKVLRKTDLLALEMAFRNEDSRQATLFGDFFSAKEKETMDEDELMFEGARRFGVIRAAIDANVTEQEMAILDEVFRKDATEAAGRLAPAVAENENREFATVDDYFPLRRLGVTQDPVDVQVAGDMLDRTAGLRRPPRNGFTKQRIKISPAHQAPVKLDLLGTWMESIDSQEHYLATAAYAKRLDAYYLDTFVQEQIRSATGDTGIKYLKEYITEIKNPGELRNRSPWENSIRGLRGNLGVAYLAFRTSSVMKQLITSPWPALPYAGPRLFTEAMKMMVNPVKYVQDTEELSVVLKNRSQDMVFEAIKANARAHGIENGLDKVNKVGMKGLELVDRLCVAVGWRGMFEAELARNGGDAEKAIEFADDNTLRTQPSSRGVDLAPIYRNAGEGTRLLLQFTQALNVVYQNLRYDIPTAVRNHQWSTVVGTVVGYMIAGVLLNAATGRPRDDETEEEKRARLLFWSLTQATDSLPLIGTEATRVLKRAVTKEKENLLPDTALPGISNVLDGMYRLSGGEIERAMVEFATGGGMIVGLPVNGFREAKRAVTGDPGALMGKPRED